MNKDKPNLESLLQTESLDNYPNGDAIQIIGTIQDVSYKNGYLDGMNHALKLADSIKARKFSKLQSGYYHYIVANIWFDRYKVLNPKKAAWKWECEDYNQVIIHHRKALRSLNDLELNEAGEKDLFCQNSTNLANLLSHLGRIIEAVEYWKLCLSKNSEFGIALGNLGHGYFAYSKLLYDPGHRGVFLKYSYNYLKKALTKDITEEAYNGFRVLIDSFEKKFSKSFLKKKENYSKWKLGVTKDEAEYRKWCLNKTLFLNPLNDLGNNSIAATDIIHLPDIITKAAERPFHHGLFNVIKQEYVSARYLLYESIQLATQGEKHFSDKDNHLVDTLDYSFHSLGIEKQKFAFRIAYSIFDKIAFFMNAYFELGINYRGVKFRTIWYTHKNGEKKIREEFDNHENWPLRGLFWLSKDLFERNNEFRNCLEPDAKELNNIRNHLEHKYLKVHMFGKENAPPFSSDNLAYSISRDDLFEKTLRILKLSRAAIMYLSFAVHIEEIYKRKDLDQSKIAPIHTTELFDGLRY